MTPEVSVIVPCYGHAAQLPACLHALEAQEHAPPYEVIVVDNREVSHVCGLHVLEGTAFPHLRVLSEPRPGSYAARNKAVRASQAEMLAFIDADCVPAPDWIAQGVAAVQRLPGPGAVGGRVSISVCDRQHPTMAEWYDLRYGFQQAHYVRNLGFAVTANLWTTRATFDEVGLFDAHLFSGGDVEWGHRVSSRLTVAYADDVLVTHPARRTVDAIARRALRVAGGTQQLLERRGSGIRWLGWDVVREVLGLRTWRRALRDRQLPTWRHRLGVASLLWLVQVLTTGERVRVHYGGAPRRA